MNKILISGVAGLVGSNLAHWILNNTNDAVIGVDNLSGGAIENIPDVNTNPFVFYKQDVEDNELFNIFETHKPNYVVHASAYAAECLSPFIRKFNVINNTLATANIVNNCINHDVQRLLFYSSMAVYGNGDGNPPYPETLVPKPIDSYGIAKYSCEMDINVAGEQHGLDWTIIRPHNIYGSRQVYWDRYRNVLGIWMFKYMQGLPLTIFGTGEQKRAFSYIDDSLPCFYKALIQPNCSKEIINLGGIKEYSIFEAAHTLIEVLEEDGNPFGDPKIVYLEPRHEVKNAYPTYQKSIDLLGFEHKTDLHEGLTKMWQWVKEDYRLFNRQQLTFNEYEVNKNMYDFWKNRTFER